MNKRRVVITGMAPICALGVGNEPVRQKLHAGEIGHITALPDYIYGKYSEDFPVYTIPNFDIHEFGLNPDLLKEMKDWKDGEEVADLYYLLAAAKLALIDGKIDGAESDARMGLVLAHENPGLEQFCSFVFKETHDLYRSKEKEHLGPEEYFNRLNRVLGTNVNDLQTFMFLFYVSRVLNIHGYSLFVNNACASGLFAIEAASQQIHAGVNDVMVVASSEHPAIYKYLWFKRLEFLSKSRQIRPFDQSRDGFICGQGGAAIVLEDYAHAQKRKAPIYGEYLGGGFALDGWKRTVPRPGKSFQEKVMRDAIAKSGIRPDDIGAINAHGIGAQLLDQFEASAIHRIFGKLPHRPLVTAYKPYVGHTLGNCALLEVILLMLNLKYSVFPPIKNLTTVDPKIDLNLVRKTTSASIHCAMKIVWGFGGYNAAAVFRQV